MKDTEHTYVHPEISIIEIEAEQVFLTESGEGSNEGLFTDPFDYSDFFEKPILNCIPT